MRPGLLWILAIFAGAAWSIAQPWDPPVIKLKFGDDPRWAAPEWDDSDWSTIKYSEFPARAGVYWVRIRPLRPDKPVHLEDLDRYAYLWPDEASGQPCDALFFSSVYSFELFLNGQRIASDGVVGSDFESERPGKLDHLVRVPAALLNRSEYVLALRMSTYHYNFPVATFSAGFQVMNFERRLRDETLLPVFPLIGAVGSLLMAATGLVLFWFVERRRALWLVSLVSVVLAVFYGLIAVRWVYPYTYDWHYPRLLAITWVLTVAGVLLLWLFLEQFAVPRKIAWFAAVVPLLAVAWQTSPIYELKVLWICRAVLAVALVVAGWAAWRRRPGARVALVGVALALLIVRTDRRVFLDPTFFLMIEGVVLLVFAALGAQVQAERRQAREAQLTAARLETELLKKNLQPHFLLNTLTAVSEVIEQDPAGAVKFVEDLAGEFRSLARMSGEKLVTLGEELELCRAHLRVVSRRLTRAYELEAEGTDRLAPVPPALFLTLIENGLVHQHPGPDLRFRLRAHQVDGGTRYEFFSPGEPRPVDRPNGGSGVRYIRARLEESFPGTWTFVQEAVTGGWSTQITVPAAAPAKEQA